MKIIKTANILLPKKEINMNKWAIVACDQYTSQIDYWNDLEKLVGKNPSTLQMILPEVYLKNDYTNKIKEINKNMIKHLESNVFIEYDNAIILCERKTLHSTRLGLVLCIDLEAYEYVPFSKALIRSTEATVIDRIPPRLMIREEAPIEFPHTIVLFDDSSTKIINNLYKHIDEYDKLYDCELNMQGGSIKGYLVSNPKEVADQLNALTEKINEGEFTFAIGDGNHSLATAKEHWLNLKKNGADDNHPARYALVELEDIYDDGIIFEPIHRVLFGVEETVIQLLEKHFTGSGKINLYFKKHKYTINVSENNLQAIKDIQLYLDELIKNNPSISIDYIHGLEDLHSICDLENGLGIEMPCMRKEELFPYVSNYGSLPRKTFSMGEAFEKRYYIEGRKIVNK